MTFLKNVIFSVIFFQATAPLATAPLEAVTYSSEWVKNIPGADEETTVFYGPTKIVNRTMTDLTIYGPANITGSTIGALATLKGPVEASHSSFNNLHIEGIAKLDEVQVAHELAINGPIFATHCTIDSILIASQELTLSNCRVNHLLVKKNSNPGEQRVYLDKGTVIGTLMFESQNGRVVSGDATVVVKHLEGGKMDAH